MDKQYERANLFPQALKGTEEERRSAEKAVRRSQKNRKKNSPLWNQG